MAERALGLWMTLAAAVLFGVAAVAAADVFILVAPTRVAQFRSVMAALVLGAVALHRGRIHPRGQLLKLILLGANLAAVTVTFYWAIERLGVGPGTTIQFTAPVLVLAWMRLAENRFVPAVGWAAAATAVAGTALMTRAWDASLDTVGVLAGVGAAVTFASYLVLGERLGAVLPSLTVIAYGFAISAFIWLVAVPPAVADLTAGAWWRLIFIGLAGTAVPFLLEVSALRRADPGSVGVVATAEPVVGAAFAWVVLGQVLTPIQVVGGLLTAVSVAAIHLFTSRRSTWPG
ncbi:MAG TPA: EamA family transporter [Acidimicrobiia bacterium]|nr:EamA family transporter [Acidimicrobiia bacterium]